MKLPYVRTVEYLSPSSLRMLEEEPVEFYRRRCGPKDDMPDREPQGYPAAVGSAFDAVVKSLIAVDLGLPCPKLKPMLKEKIENDTHRKQAISEGLRLGAAYVACGAMDALKRDGITAIEPGECIKKVFGIPVRGDLDAILRDAVPADWKVIGSGAPGTRSPTQGYARLWTTKKPGLDMGPHKKHGAPLEKYQESWATQLTMYGWLLGWPVKLPMEYAVDEVVVGNMGHVRVAQHRGTISTDFQRSLRARLKAAWKRIVTEKVVPDVIGAGEGGRFR